MPRKKGHHFIIHFHFLQSPMPPESVRSLLLILPNNWPRIGTHRIDTNTHYTSTTNNTENRRLEPWCKAYAPRLATETVKQKQSTVSVLVLTTAIRRNHARSGVLFLYFLYSWQLDWSAAELRAVLFVRACDRGGKHRYIFPAHVCEGMDTLSSV